MPIGKGLYSGMAKINYSYRSITAGALDIRHKDSAIHKAESVLKLLRIMAFVCTLGAAALPATARDLTFLHTSDLHYGSGVSGEPERNAGNIKAMNTIGGTTAKFVIVSGDLTNNGYSWQWDLFNAAYPKAGGTGTGVIHYPVYACTGNHDRNDLTGSANAAKDGVVARHGSLTYSWNNDGVHFVNLDLYPEDANRDWLVNDLAGVPTATPIVIVTHYGFTTNSQKYWGDNGVEWGVLSERYKNVLGQHNVIALLHGHDHYPYSYTWEGYDVFEAGTSKTEGYGNCFAKFHIGDNTLTWNPNYWMADGTIQYSYSLDIQFTNRYFDGANSTVWNNAATMNWGHSPGYYNSIWIDGCKANFEGTGATVNVGSIASVDSMAFEPGGYVLTGGSITLTGAGGNISTFTGTTTIVSAIAGSVGLTKSGSGTLVLNGANTYSGTTTIGGGALLVNGSLSSQSAVSVQNGAFLGGTGVIGGSVSVDPLGALSPGNSIGTLTINNELSLGGNTIMEVNKTGTTLTNDQIVGVTGLTYGGILTVTGTGDAFSEGDSWKLFTADSYEGSFSGYSLPTLTAGLSWDMEQLPLNGTIGIVPEPGSITLLGSGLLVFLTFLFFAQHRHDAVGDGLD
jgi:autotransporter-associated beta strand protein